MGIVVSCLKKKKKKRPGKNGTLHQRSPSKILQMPMDGGLQLLYPQKGIMWLSYLEVLFQLGKQLEGISIKATICYLQA